MKLDTAIQINELDQLSPDRVYTYADYLKWRFKERVELFRGKVMKMSPAPSLRHQEISFKLSGVLYNNLKDRKCSAFTAPFDVRLTQGSGDENEIYTVVQPDLCIICDASKLDQQGCKGVPDLIVEILSHNSAAKDVKEKYDLYEEAGVPEYWIIHPDEKLLEIFVLENDKYVHTGWHSDQEVVNSLVIKDLSIDLKEVL
ncbi:MAG: Uma2 family endonuclease [Bacteroidota bacterium]